MYSMALVLAFLVAENENQQLEDLPLADFGCLPQRLLLLVRTKSINEIFYVENYDHCCFCNCDSTHFSILRVYCVYMIKKNNTWVLIDMEFLFSSSTRHLTHSLCSLVSYRVKHSKRNSTSTRAYVLFSINPSPA